MEVKQKLLTKTLPATLGTVAIICTAVLSYQTSSWANHIVQETRQQNSRMDQQFKEFSTVMRENVEALNTDLATAQANQIELARSLNSLHQDYQTMIAKYNNKLKEEAAMREQLTMLARTLDNVRSELKYTSLALSDAQEKSSQKDKNLELISHQLKEHQQLLASMDIIADYVVSNEDGDTRLSREDLQRRNKAMEALAQYQSTRSELEFEEVYLFAQAD